MQMVAEKQVNVWGDFKTSPTCLSAQFMAGNLLTVVSIFTLPNLPNRRFYLSASFSNHNVLKHT